MSTKSIGLAALVSLSLFACGGTTISSSSSTTGDDPTTGTGQTSSAYSICDGSAGTRFLYLVGGGGEAPPPDQIVMFENGDQILSIDGTCHYWSYSFYWGQVHTGTVDAKMASDLSSALHVDQWSAWKAAEQSSTSSCIGCAGGEIRLGNDVLQLEFDGSATSTSGLADLIHLVDADFEELQTGPEVAGGVRLMMYPYDSIIPTSSLPTTPWPLTSDPATLADADMRGDMAGTSKLISDATDAAKLRALRDEYLAGDHGSIWNGGELDVVGPDGTVYGLWFRDVMPDEDASGRTNLF